VTFSKLIVTLDRFQAVLFTPILSVDSSLSIWERESSAKLETFSMFNIFSMNVYILSVVLTTVLPIVDCIISKVKGYKHQDYIKRLLRYFSALVVGGPV